MLPGLPRPLYCREFVVTVGFVCCLFLVFCVLAKFQTLWYRKNKGREAKAPSRALGTLVLKPTKEIESFRTSHQLWRALGVERNRAEGQKIAMFFHPYPRRCSHNMQDHADLGDLLCLKWGRGVRQKNWRQKPKCRKLETQPLENIVPSTCTTHRLGWEPVVGIWGLYERHPCRQLPGQMWMRLVLFCNSHSSSYYNLLDFFLASVFCLGRKAQQLSSCWERTRALLSSSTDI